MATIEQVKNLLKKELSLLHSKLENILTTFNELKVSVNFFSYYFFENLSYFAVIVINCSSLFYYLFIYLFIFALSCFSLVFIVNVISAVVAN